jgi:hypothetical protein
MTIVAFSVIIASIVALLVVGTEDMGSGHTVFANRVISGHEAFTNRGINVETDTNQDQGCEGAGGTSGITNACTATSGPGPMQTSTQTTVTLIASTCSEVAPDEILCSVTNCNNIGCTLVVCAITGGPLPCNTDNSVQLTSCVFHSIVIGSGGSGGRITCTLTKTHTVPGTGITNSGGVTGDDAG